MNLKEVAQQVHENSKAKGFWNGFNPETNATEFFLMKLALIHSEVTEVLEAYRKSQGPDKVADEFADVVIRTLDLFEVMETFGYVTPDLEKAIAIKMKKNTTRPQMHGVLA